MTDSTIKHLCSAPLHPQAAEGLRLFNAGEYFEAHESLEAAWLEEQGKVRELYRGILQIAVVYLHATRQNYNGVIKVYGRSQRWLKDWPDSCRGIHVAQLQKDAAWWLKDWPDSCRGIHVAQLQKDAASVVKEIERLGIQNISQFDNSLLKPIQWIENPPEKKHIYICDRCGHEMNEKNCKVTCPNCGNRFDCSDLNIYFD